MSAEDNFIARWSRLKQQAADEKRKPRADTEPEDRRSLDADGEVAEATSGPGGASVGPAETEPAFDPASLPSIESIVAGSDIRAFLQKGVPAALTKAALRRAWTTDPAIRDFIEVAENQWDFTDPTAIPGFGPLQASDDLRQLVGQALGNLPEAPDSSHASGGSQESTDGVASAQSEVDTGPGEAPTEASASHMQVASSLEHADDPDESGVAASQHARPASEAGNAPRRKAHGRAMPR
jgi:Protein of unknown function (DUF3306)